MLAKEMNQYMVNSSLSVGDITQTLNESKKKGVTTEDQANSFQYKTNKTMRDFR